MKYTAKVEKIITTDRGGKSVQFSGGYNQDALFTGKDKNKNPISFPDQVKEGAEITFDIEVVTTRSGGEWRALSFPDYTQAPAQSPAKADGGWKGGGRPSEDQETKIASIAVGYARDMYMNTPDATLEGMLETGEKIAFKIQEIATKLRH